MFRKIITYFLITAVVLPVLASAVPLPAGSQAFGANIAYAAVYVKDYGKDKDITKKTSNSGSISSPCDLATVKDAGAALGEIATKTVDPLNVTGAQSLFKNSGGSTWNCVSYTIVNILYDFVMMISIWVTGLASDIFNTSISFSLTSEIFDPAKNIMINDGWTFVRDLLNLVFIFILLFAAISTILQYGGFEIKKVLPSLIVVALLVNFSMMIAKMVIDASHIFAFEFYNQIESTQDGEVADIQSSVEVKSDQYFKKKNLANVFLAGFNPQRILIEGGIATTTEEGEMEISPWEKVYEKAMKDTPNDKKSILDTLWMMALIILLEAALAFFASFILLAGAIMFVARVVILWLVMIFSPIAFLGMILPSMEKYSKMWWGYLIGQSFFAPAFLFMFMLTTKMVNIKFVENLLTPDPSGNSLIVLGLDGGKIAIIFFNFFVVGGLMMACLIVARQLGGKTAEFGISWAHKGKDLALGGALKYLPKPLLRHTVGAVSSDMAKSDWAQKLAARFPVMGGAVYKTLQKGAQIGQHDKILKDKTALGRSLKTAELRAKYYDNLDDRTKMEWYQTASARERVELHDKTSAKTQKTLNKLFNTLSSEEQEKTIKSRAEVDLKKTDDQLANILLDRSEEIQKEILNQMKDARKAGFIDKLYAQKGTTPEFNAAIVSTAPTGNNIRKFRPDSIDTSTMAGMTFLEEAIKKHKPEDVLLLNKNISNNPEVIREMVKNYKGGHVNKIIERGDELYTKFKEEIRSISGGSNRVSDVVSNLQRIGNSSLASIIQSNEIMQKSLGLV